MLGEADFPRRRRHAEKREQQYIARQSDEGAAEMRITAAESQANGRRIVRQQEANRRCELDRKNFANRMANETVEQNQIRLQPCQPCIIKSESWISATRSVHNRQQSVC